MGFHFGPDEDQNDEQEEGTEEREARIRCPRSEMVGKYTAVDGTEIAREWVVLPKDQADKIVANAASCGVVLEMEEVS